MVRSNLRSDRSIRSHLPLTLLALGVLGTLLFQANAAADTATIIASRDNTLYEDTSGNLSNGAGNHVFVGTTGQSSGNKRRALLFFDVTSLPDRARIDSVTLSVNCNNVANGSSRTVGVHRVLGSWGEGTSNAGRGEGAGASSRTNDATWIHRFFSDTTWNAAGGDFVSEASGTVAISGPGSYTVSSTAALISDVQRWVDNPNVNAGWILVTDESQQRTAKRLDSRESGTPANRPTLTIEFTREEDFLACRRSRVNAGNGNAVDVLTLNGSTGNGNGVVNLATGAPISVSMQASPGGPSPGPFVMYLHIGEPVPQTPVVTLPRNLGLFCFPIPPTGGNPQPFKIWNNIGRQQQLGNPDFPSTPAPSVVLNAPAGAPNAVTATLQAILLDDGSAADGPASVTNAIILRVQ